MKRILALLLTVCVACGMMTVMSGCNFGGETKSKEKSSESAGKKSNLISKENLKGEWVTEIDLQNIIDDYLKSDEEDVDKETIEVFEKYMDFSGVKMPFSLKITSDKAKFSFDKNKSEDFQEKFKKAVKDGMLKYLEKTLAETGQTISVEDALKQAGTSLDELIDGMMQGMNLEDGIDTKGTYKIKKNKIYLTDDKEDGEEVWTVKLSGKKLEITDIDSGDDSLDSILPIVLTKK